MVVILVVGIAAGAAITTGLPGRLLDDVSAGDARQDVDPGADVRLNPVPAEPARSADGSLRAADPGDAVAGFLGAEIAGELGDAYAHLSAAEQQEFHSAKGYVAAHADLLPPVLRYELVDVEVDGDVATVVTDVALRPSLDPIMGLVPGDAEITWTTVAEDGGWAVELTSAEMRPRFLDDGLAPDHVAGWVAARQGCASAGDREQRPLRGAARLADDLCDKDGDVRVGAVGPLPDIDGGAYLSAYGGDVASWARVVDVEAPTALRAVVAPIGDRWIVIGVLEPTSRR